MSDTESGAGGAKIAGFWRRLLAALLDGVILAVPAYLIGFQFFDQLAAMGQNARFIGAAVALLYFGLLNSSVGGGQTLGKRVMGIRVVGASGEAIGVLRSIARWFVLALPYYLNGMDLTPFAGSDDAQTVALLGALAAFVVIGLGGAHVYLYIFNRKTRQSLHDLMLETYVVRAPSSGEVGVRVWPMHVAIALAFIAAGGLVLPAALRPLADRMVGDETFEALRQLESDIEALPGIERAVLSTESVTTTEPDKATSTTSYLSVTVYLRQRISAAEPMMKDVARVVLKRAPELLDQQQLRIVVATSFDLGLVQATDSVWASATADQWRDALGDQDPGKAIIVNFDSTDTVRAFVGQVWGLIK